MRIKNFMRRGWRRGEKGEMAKARRKALRASRYFSIETCSACAHLEK